MLSDMLKASFKKEHALKTRCDGNSAPIASPNKQGTLMLADISGFTRFVKKINPEIGIPVIHGLLETIMDEDAVGFEVNEIEGDAVLFYRIGNALAIADILQYFENMSFRFHQKLREFETVLGGHYLELKVILHYGSFSIFQVGQFTKLYGTAVIEAHRLLKNSIGKKHYLLVTQNYIDAAKGDAGGAYSLQLCESYDDIGSICFSVMQAA